MDIFEAGAEWVDEQLRNIEQFAVDHYDTPVIGYFMHDLHDLVRNIRDWYELGLQYIVPHEIPHNFANALLALHNEGTQHLQRYQQSLADFHSSYQGATKTQYVQLSQYLSTQHQDSLTTLQNAHQSHLAIGNHFSDAGMAMGLFLPSVGLAFGSTVATVDSGGTSSPVTVPSGVGSGVLAGIQSITITQAFTALGVIIGGLGLGAGIAWAVDHPQSIQEILQQLKTFMVDAEGELLDLVDQGVITIEVADAALKLLESFPGLGINGAILLAKAIVSGALSIGLVYSWLSRICPALYGEIAQLLIDALTSVANVGTRSVKLLEKLAELTARAASGDLGAQREITEIARIGLDHIADVERPFPASNGFPSGEIDIVLRDPATGNEIGGIEVGDETKITTGKFADQLPKYDNYFREHGIQDPDLGVAIESEQDKAAVQEMLNEGLKGKTGPWTGKIGLDTFPRSEIQCA